jgi:hypothetical protein
MEEMSCIICLEKYDLQRHLPVVLPCGHTVCEYCLKRLLPDGRPGLDKCPQRCSTRALPVDRSKLKRNFELVSQLNATSTPVHRLLEGLNLTSSNLVLSAHQLRLTPQLLGEGSFQVVRGELTEEGSRQVCLSF